MSRGQALGERIIARIRESPFSLTVHFPAQRQVATGSSPTSAPVSPLTRPYTAQAITPPETPSRAPLDMPCLWYSGYDGSSTAVRRGELTRGGFTWRQDADAMARVLSTDAELDPLQPYGESVFSRCTHVEFQGKQYKVVGVNPVTSGWKQATSLHVWFTGEVS